MANVGPLGILAIAPLIRKDLGLSVTQAGSFLSAYDIGPGLLGPLAAGIGLFGVGWNGGQHTLMAELAGPRAVGLGFAISSLGVTVCPPACGLVVERVGGYGFAWGTLAAGMVVALLLLIPVRERATATS